MLTETDVVDSDDYFLKQCLTAYGANLPRMFELQKYVDGDALIPDNTTAAQREGYMRLMQRSRLHVVETIRDARTERQTVVGFRTAADDDDMGDDAAWSIFVRNEMSVQLENLTNWSADFGCANVIIEDVEGLAGWTVYNGWDTYGLPDPKKPWLNQAGIRVAYSAEAGGDVAFLYRPGYLRVAVHKTDTSSIPMDGTEWIPNDEWEWVGAPIKQKSEKCLIQSYRTTDGKGIWEKHRDTIDRINEITLNALTLIVMQSFRQRAVKGDLPDVYPADHPLAGESVNYDEIFATGPAALWKLPKDAEVWESAAVDVTPIYKARKEELMTLSSLTRTPQDIFDNTNQSALGAQIGREPLKYAVQKMNQRLDTFFRVILGIGFEIEGDATRAESAGIETIFKITRKGGGR